MSEPREWYIHWPQFIFIKEPLGQVYNIFRMVTNYEFSDSVHVIEKSYADQLEQKIKELEATINAMENGL